MATGAGTLTVAIPRLPWTASLALVPIGLAFGLVGEWLRGRVGWPWWWMALDFAAGAAFLLAGGFGWRRRPESNVGPLMVVAGFAWFVGTYTASQNPVVDEFAYAFGGWYHAFLAWIVLAWPSGRLGRPAALALVGALLAVVAARTAFRFWVYEPIAAYDLLTAEGVDQYIADQQLRAAGEQLFDVVGVALLVALAVILVFRLRSASTAGRWITGPMLLGGLVLVAGSVLELAGSSLDLGLDVPGRANLSFLVVTASTVAVPLAFAAGLVRSRSARSAVADLVVELERAPGPPRLRDVLARALGDPSVDIVYPAPHGDGFVDATGRPAVIPDPADALRAVTRLERDGRTVALLVHDPALSEAPELVRSVGAATSLALENERLQAEVRAQLEEVRASRARIVAAADAERQRIERDLHDGAQQRLVALALLLDMARARAGRDPELDDLLAKAVVELDAGTRELRELARGLHPVALDEGLAGALQALAERLPLDVQVDAPLERFAPRVEATAYFVIAEALTNVVRYAGARAARVVVTSTPDRLVVEVADDGVGGADPDQGSGLRGLADRVAAVDGRFSLTSPAGGGTIVRAEIPCA